jgi:ATP-dependent DNA helicase RecQ
MKDYAYAKSCRREFLLRYFGETGDDEQCTGCDVCSGARLDLTAARPASRTASSRVTDGAFDGAHSELALGELKAWRRELARDLGIPPYIIFNDATLTALATALPIDREDFLQVKGTGESRWERFGAKVREISLLARAAGHTPLKVALPRVTRRRGAGRRSA